MIEQSNKENQRLKNQLFEELKAKVFLFIADTRKLIGIIRQTAYRMIERGCLIAGKAGKRTIIRRSDLEQLLFNQAGTVAPQPKKKPKQMQFDISEYYDRTEVQDKYGI